MSFIIFNIPGIVIVAISFAIAFGVGHLTGTSAEGPLMIIAGSLAAAFDVIYRLKQSVRHWFHPSYGGSLFFLPVWIFGVLWMVLGVVYTINGSTELERTASSPRPPLSLCDR